MATKSNVSSTQKYLDISEIRNDCVILKNGSLCSVILSSSINFGLKSSDEQKAVIQNYISFLNTIDFPMQIIIQSRPFNIKPYLAELESLRKKHTNELLKIQMADYASFVKEWVVLGEIMSRKFYIVLLYNPAGDKKIGFFARISELFSAARTVKMNRIKIEKYKEKLFRRVDIVTSALSSMGVSGVPLDTQSLIELFYNSYNPAESEMQKITEVKKLRLED